MVKIVLIAGGALTFAAFLITALSSIDSADRDGRIAMPGEAALELESGKYGLFYEEAVETSDNETFEPPDGIRIRVRGLGGAPDPEVDLGGLGGQIATDDRTAESIGKIEVAEDGRYGVVVGPPPRPGVKPTITVGESPSGAFVRALKLAGIIAAGTGLLAGLLTLVSAGARVRPPRRRPPVRRRRRRRRGPRGRSSRLPRRATRRAPPDRRAREARRAAAHGGNRRGGVQAPQGGAARRFLKEVDRAPVVESGSRACPPLFGSGQVGPRRMSGSA